MKRFTDFSTIAFLLFVLSTSGIKAIETNEANNTPIVGHAISIAKAKMNNQFVTVEREHPTTGTVKIIQENGKQYLQFEDDFSTVEGPAVEIILHRNNAVPINIEEENYVSIAPIQSFKGTQRYELPEGIDLDRYASVAVWCREFNITFGYARL